MIQAQSSSSPRPVIRSQQELVNVSIPPHVQRNLLEWHIRFLWKKIELPLNGCYSRDMLTLSPSESMEDLCRKINNLKLFLPK
jgi:hypothetical protein